MLARRPGRCVAAAIRVNHDPGTVPLVRDEISFENRSVRRNVPAEPMHEVTMKRTGIVIAVRIPILSVALFEILAPLPGVFRPAAIKRNAPPVASARFHFACVEEYRLRPRFRLLKPFQDAVALGLLTSIHLSGPRKIEVTLLGRCPDADFLIKFRRRLNLPIRVRRSGGSRKRNEEDQTMQPSAFELSETSNHL